MQEKILKIFDFFYRLYYNGWQSPAARAVKIGAERARERAAATLAEARKIMGIRKFY